MVKKLGSLIKREWKRIVTLLLVAILVLNTLSFALYRVYFMCRGCVDLVTTYEDSSSNVVNYVLAGTLNQSEAVFEQFLPEFEGSVVYVNFMAFGWDPEVAAAQIAEDIVERQAEARIWAISVSSQVAHLVDGKADGVKIVAINPCTTADCLAEQFRGLNWLAHLLRGIGSCLGWVSALPLIPAAGADTGTDAGQQKYSIMLLLDQLVATTGGINQAGPYVAELVIISSHDQLLDIDMERAIYADSARQICEIEADHAGTTVYADAYREAFRTSGLTQ